MKLRTILAAGVLLVAGFIAPQASAVVTFSLSNGSACGAGAATTFTPGVAQTVSLCVTTSTEAFCGATIKLVANTTSTGLFSITARALNAAVLPDATTAAPVFPLTITVPASGPDLGGTPLSTAAPTAAGATTLLETFTILPSASATAAVYTISSDTSTSLSVPAPNCATPGDPAGAPTQGSFTFNKALAATAATFTALPATLTFAEGGPTQNITVACTGTIGTPSPVVINVGSTGTGFSPAAAPLSFTTCPSSQTVVVTPRAADIGSNPTQTGTVTFATTTTGATAPASVGVTVTDNQSPAVYSVSTPTVTVTENNVATGTMTVSCTGAFTGGLTSGSVQYAITGLTNPGDIAAPALLTGPINFSACPSSQSVTISPRANDAVVQGNKSGTFTISTPVGGSITTATGSIAVNDDDTPQTITVAVGGSPATETSGILTYTFTRAGGNAAAVTAPLTVNITPVAANTRYTVSAACAASTITFAGGSPTATCTVTGVPNTVVDGNVNALIAVAAPTAVGSYVVGTPSSATGVIADDDFGVSPTASVSSVIEGQPAVFNINCNGAVGNFTVAYTLTGQDAGTVATPASPATLACTTGTSRLTITVPTIDDALIGNTRTIRLRVISVATAGTGPSAVVVGTPDSADVVVIDNDVPKDVPTMSSIALGMMALMIFGFAAFSQRRRRD